MSFYKAVIEKSGKDVKFVAVMPQTIEDARQHLKSFRLDVNEVHNASLSSIGVTATPTLLLVGQDGIVLDSWRGKLKADKEAEVIAKLSS